jgi:hypothetical protein
MFWLKGERIMVVNNNNQRKETLLGKSTINHKNLFYFINRTLIKEWQIHYFIMGVDLTSVLSPHVLCFYYKKIIPVTLTIFLTIEPLIGD